MTSNPKPDELRPPAAADHDSVVRLTHTDEISIINRYGRSTHPREKSVQRSGATPGSTMRGATRRYPHAWIRVDRGCCQRPRFNKFRSASATALDCMYVALMLLTANREIPTSRKAVGLRRQFDPYRSRRIGGLGLSPSILVASQ